MLKVTTNENNNQSTYTIDKNYVPYHSATVAESSTTWFLNNLKSYICVMVLLHTEE